MRIIVLLTFILSSISSYSENSPCTVNAEALKNLESKSDFGWIGPFVWIFYNIDNPGYSFSSNDIKFYKSLFDLNNDGLCEVIAYEPTVKKDGDGGPAAVKAKSNIYALQNQEYRNIGSFTASTGIKSTLGKVENGFYAILADITPYYQGLSGTRVISVYSYDGSTYSKKETLKLSPSEAAELGFRGEI